MEILFHVRKLISLNHDLWDFEENMLIEFCSF